MSITEASQVSWFTRIKDAIVGIFFGGALFVGSFIVLFWNEGRAVKTAQALEEGANAVISADADKIDSAKEGKLVHVSGRAEASSPAVDQVFGVSAPALRLRRTVEMYQWNEKKDTKSSNNVGGSQTNTTTYSYEKIWSERAIASDGFKESGHQNPSALPAQSATFDAQAAVGPYALTSSLLDRLSAFSTLPVSAAAATAPGGPWRAVDGALYHGANPADAAVGDVRVRFGQVGPTDVSLVSRQSGRSFQPYHARSGRDVELLVEGRHGADEMFADAEKSNETLTWILRGAGWFAMFLGLVLILRPLTVLADVIPFVGSIIGAGGALIAALVSVVLSCVVIALAWIAYRPLIGGALLLAAVVGGVTLGGKLRGAAPAARTAVNA